MASYVKSCLPIAVQSVRNAISLDAGGQTKDAYCHYLSCMLFILQSLKDEAWDRRELKEVCYDDTFKLFKLTSQCFERAWDLLKSLQGNADCGASSAGGGSGAPGGDGGRSQAGGGNRPLRTSTASEPGSASLSESPSATSQPGSHHPVGNDVSGRSSRKSLISALPSPPVTQPPAPGAKSLSPNPSFKYAQSSVVQNHQMFQAYQRRKSLRGRVNQRYAAASYNLSLLRQEAELLAIGKAKMAAMQKRIQLEEEKMKEEADRRMRTRQAAQHSDQDFRKKLLTDALKFEQENAWVRELRDSLAVEKDSIILIAKVVKAVLRSKEHPLGMFMHQLQFSLYQKIQPLVKDFLPPRETIPPPMDAFRNERESLMKSHRASVDSKSADGFLASEQMANDSGESRSYNVLEAHNVCYQAADQAPDAGLDELEKYMFDSDSESESGPCSLRRVGVTDNVYVGALTRKPVKATVDADKGENGPSASCAELEPENSDGRKLLPNNVAKRCKPVLEVEPADHYQELMGHEESPYIVMAAESLLGAKKDAIIADLPKETGPQRDHGDQDEVYDVPRQLIEQEVYDVPDQGLRSGFYDVPKGSIKKSRAHTLPAEEVDLSPGETSVTRTTSPRSRSLQHISHLGVTTRTGRSRSECEDSSDGNDSAMVKVRPSLDDRPPIPSSRRPKKGVGPAGRSPGPSSASHLSSEKRLKHTRIDDEASISSVDQQNQGVPHPESTGDGSYGHSNPSELQTVFPRSTTDIDSDHIYETIDKVEEDYKCIRSGSVLSTASTASVEAKPAQRKFSAEPFQENAVNVDDMVNMLNTEFLKDLETVVRDVQCGIDRLHTVFILAFDELDSPIGRDQSYATVEAALFEPVWPWLILLFRRMNYTKEITLWRVMLRYKNRTPAEMNIREQFALVEDKEPYQEVIDELNSITGFSCPLDKLECAVRASKAVCHCVEKYWTDHGKQTAPSVGCDDLLPILSYIIVKTQLPSLVAECHAMEEFIHEGYLMGEEGYCLTTLHAALSYLLSLSREDVPASS